MLREERLWQISQKLLKERKVLASELATSFDLTPATIRLDLAELEKRGLARRVYGGAVLAVTNHELYPPSFNEPRFMDRIDVLQSEKEAIGRVAAGLVNDGETIMIDGGTTSFQVCRNLDQKRGLTIVSCALNNLWPELAATSDLKIFLTGGYLQPESLSLVGEVAENMLHGFRANKAILGIDGISLEHGLTTMDFMEAGVKKRMIQASQELIIAADHSKFGKVGLIPVAPIESIRTLVTDDKAPIDLVRGLRQRGVTVLIAAGDSFDKPA